MSTQENAIAGPSTVFLRPERLVYHHPKSFLRNTEDLLGRFNLHGAYDKYVRPFAVPAAGTGAAAVKKEEDESAVVPVPNDVKGKGKERESSSNGPETPAGGALGDNVLDDDDKDPNEKKRKNTYRHLIRGIPGKHKFNKDPWFMENVIQKEKNSEIRRFDDHQLESFIVSAEGLKGWNASALVLESAQAREDRKKRKELKRLAKAQAAGTHSAGVSTPLSAVPPASAHSQAPTRTQTPRPTVQTTGLPKDQQQPKSSAQAQPRSALVSTPNSALPLTPSATEGQRGTKRPLEEQLPSANANANVRAGAPTGVNGVKARPVKKAKTDALTPVQQPTPQGVQ